MSHTDNIMPSASTLEHACKFAISKDKPIILDYWESSLDKSSMIAVSEEDEKMLVKSSTEYTSPIEESNKSGSEYILITHNSIYIVHQNIPIRRLQN
jgi:hypothetical protein